MILCIACGADSDLAATDAYSVDPCEACGNGQAGHQLYETHDA